jgi:Holliday junction resolvase-like predicted endonuclease
MTEFEIQRRIIKPLMLDGFRCFAPNLMIGFGEADFLGLRGSGFAEEFEIKITQSDFRRDAKKITKHQVYDNRELLEKILKKQKRLIPNRFNYVLVDGIDTNTIPEFAGCYILKDYKLERIKFAPLLHNHKLDWLPTIATGLTWRYIKYMYASQTKQIKEEEQ